MKEKKEAGSWRPRPVVQAIGGDWKALQWRVLERQVVSMQKEIYQASQRGDRQSVQRVQQQVLEAEAARLLAVRRVAEENEGKDTAGIDGVKSLMPEERLAMASAIHPAYWSQQPPRPVRRVWIPKPGTLERRPLGILTMMDRCKQALVKLALEPEWEAKFEEHSYGYRPGRGAPDAINALLGVLKQQSCYVFDADIEAAFESVSHSVLLETLQTAPVLRQVIDGWLKAGVVDGNAMLPSPVGMSQGGVLSPLLMNIALHGMEEVARGSGKELPLLVRFADDFVVLHADLQELQQAVRRIKVWLAKRGLHLNVQKTRITHTMTPFEGQAGLDFLGFTLRQYQGVNAAGFRTIVTPSEEASKRHLASIGQRLLKLQMAPQAQVIRELNPLIGGWAAYYKGMVAGEVMGRYDEQIDHVLMQWASKRHPNKAREWLRSRYWQKVGRQEWMFVAPEGGQLRTYRQVDAFS